MVHHFLTPSGSLNQRLSSSAIEEANKEVTTVLWDPGKRHPLIFEA